MRSRRSGIARAAMMPGSAHAWLESSGMNACPGRPNGRSARSTTNDARARYPVSSSSENRKNNKHICGRNTAAPPTPVITPSTSMLVISPSGKAPATNVPREPNIESMKSIGIVAKRKSAQNTPVITITKTSTPSTGCVNARSSRSVNVSSLGVESASAICANRSTQARSPDGSLGGVVVAYRGCASASASRSIPSPVRADTATTGAPSSASSASVLIAIPRRRAMSIMLIATTVGSRRRSASPSSCRFRGRLVASSTTHTASGARSGSPLDANDPSSACRHTRASC